MKTHNLDEKVYNIVRKIPEGKVMTYKQVADKIGIKAYRAIGQALKQNPHGSVPCHRVIRSDGKIGGYRGDDQKKKKELLRKEGVKIKGCRVEIL